MLGIRKESCAWLLLVSIASAIGAVPRSSAQEVAPTGGYTPGLAVGGWMLYPSIFVGADYDSNFNQSATGNTKDSGTSLRVSPRLTGSYDGGIHKTTIYGVVDARFFNADNIAASAGVLHTYEAMQDLIFDFYGNYTRQTDIFNSALQFNNNAIGPPATPNVNLPVILNPFGTTPGANPIAYNQFTAAAGGTKTFDQAFVTLRGTAFNISYDHSDNTPAPFQTSHNGSSFWLSGRVGYNLPSFYVFAQGDGIFQRFDNSVFNTDGYRVFGGVGTNDPNSLFKGEVYGGYQFQNQNQQNAFAPGIPNVFAPGIPQDTGNGVFGGRLSYFPTEYWTIVAQIDANFVGMATFLAPNTPQGAPIRTTTAILQTTYGIAQNWSIGVRGGYTRGDYIGVSGLNNHGWLAGASFNYEIWRNLLLTLDYQYSTVQSDAVLSSFNRNWVSAGFTYKY
jgi:hypothetical protein